jgi:hypothetical protein
VLERAELEGGAVCIRRRRAKHRRDIGRHQHTRAGWRHRCRSGGERARGLVSAAGQQLGSRLRRRRVALVRPRRPRLSGAQGRPRHAQVTRCRSRRREHAVPRGRGCDLLAQRRSPRAHAERGRNRRALGPGTQLRLWRLGLRRRVRLPVGRYRRCDLACPGGRRSRRDVRGRPEQHGGTKAEV